MALTPTPRLALRRIDEPEGVDIDTDINDNWSKLDAFVSGEYDRPRPFFLKSAVYNAGQNRMDLVWGPGRARFVPDALVTKADGTTSTIPAPSAGTTYYVGLKADGTFPVATSQAEQAGVVWLWSVTTASPVGNPATLADLRGELPGAYAQGLADLLDVHTGDATDVHGVTGNVVGTGGAQTLAGPKTLTAPVLNNPVIGATGWAAAVHAHAAANSGGPIATSALTGAISTTQHGALGPITNAHALADLSGTVSDAQHGARGGGATHPFTSITGGITDAQHGVRTQANAHGMAQISGTVSDTQHGVRSLANAHDWTDISGKPTTFTPAAHTLASHSGNISAGQHGALGAGATHTLYAPLTGAAFTGNITGTAAVFSGEVAADIVDVANAIQFANVTRISMLNGFLRLFAKSASAVSDIDLVTVPVDVNGHVGGALLGHLDNKLWWSP